ncbi:MAG: hypothetical protein WCQ99_03690 [Pseudomonadota bacterium]
MNSYACKLLLPFSILFLLAIPTALNISNVFKSVFGFAVAASFFYWYFFFLLLCLYKAESEACFGKKDTFQIVLSFIVIMVFTYAYISREKFIYFWDYGNYWIKSIRVCGDIVGHPTRVLVDVWKSICFRDYNDFIPLFTSFPTHILTPTYLTFELINVACFSFPAALVIYLVYSYSLKLLGKKPAPILLCFLTVSFVPPFMSATLNGYADVAATLTTATIILLTITIDWKKLQLIRYVAIGALLLIAIIERRYFAFFVTSYFAAFGVFAIVQFFLAEQDRRLMVKNQVISLLVIGLTFAVLLLLLFLPLLIRGLTNNFSFAYSAYGEENYWDRIPRSLEHFGNIYLGFAALGLAILFRRKATRGISLFLFVLFAGILLSFCRIQNMGWCHALSLVSAAAPLFLIGLTFPLMIESRIWVKVLMTIAAVVLIVPMLAASYTSLESRFPLITIGTSRDKMIPRTRNDIRELQLIYAKFSSLKQRTYILGSSVILNYSVFKCLYLPDPTDMGLVVPTSDVDFRDGFNTGFFDCNIVVLGIPAQLHLARGQQVVEILAKELSDNGRLAQHYKLIAEYKLDSGVTAKILGKIKPFSRDDIIQIRDAYDKIYPDHPELFRDRFDTYLLSYQ